MSEKNEVKNEKKKKPVANGKMFSKDYQPSPKSKSKGWDRRREAQKIMDKMLEYQNITYKELLSKIEELEKSPEKFTVLEMKILRYLFKEGNTTDYLDRHISKAPTNLDIKGNLSISDIRDMFSDDPDDKGE